MYGNPYPAYYQKRNECVSSGPLQGMIRSSPQKRKEHLSEQVYIPSYRSRIYGNPESD